MIYYTWRDRCRPVIAEVIRANQGQDLKTIRRALREAYPWGERKYWPYKVWCDEIRRQLGLKPIKKDPRQRELFSENIDHNGQGD